MFKVRLAIEPGGRRHGLRRRARGGDGDALGARRALPSPSRPPTGARPSPSPSPLGRDLDATDDLATIALQASGLATEMVTVHLRDDNNLQLRVSAATLALDEGMTGTFTVALTQQPSLDVAVAVGRTAGDERPVRLGGRDADLHP